MSVVRKIARWFKRLGLAGLLATIAYVVVGMLLSLVTVNGQPDSGNDVVIHAVDRVGLERFGDNIAQIA